MKETTVQKLEGLLIVADNLKASIQKLIADELNAPKEVKTRQKAKILAVIKEFNFVKLKEFYKKMIELQIYGDIDHMLQTLVEEKEIAVHLHQEEQDVCIQYIGRRS